MKLTLLFVLSTALVLSACGKKTEYRKAEEITINGAGATFPFPIYSQWAHEYESLTGMRMNYQSIGSGGGIAQIKAKTVDFGASDAPLSGEELDAEGLCQFPMIIGGVVPVVNVQGVEADKVRLTGDLLARIYLGVIKKWNDPAIVAVNPDVPLPAANVTVVHRADGSGTTHIFTSYLAAVSPEWKAKVGAGKAVEWPTGVGGKGNEGVAAFVQKTTGAIGYVEYAYALQTNLAFAQLQNSSGGFVPPSVETFTAAAANADWKSAPGYGVMLINQPGDQSWSITGVSWILVHREQPDADKARVMLEFFDWCLRRGQESAKKLDYVPIPPNVVELIQSTWAGEIMSDGKAVWEARPAETRARG